MAVTLAAPSGPITVEVNRDPDRVAAAWEELAAQCAPSVYATPGFVLPWSEHVAPARGFTPHYFVARRGDRPIAFVPLALGRFGPIPILMPLSDSHSNMNGGLFAPGWEGSGSDLRNALLTLVPEAEGLRLTNIADEAGNPLARGARPAMHDALGGSFEGGFAGHLARVNGVRKRKKHRQGARRFEEVGGWAVRRVDDPDEAVSLLDKALTLFAARFAREGIEDPFAPRGVRSFMAAMLRASCELPRPAMAIWVLEVNDRVIAIQAGGGARDRFSLMFTVYEQGVLDAATPGEFLLHEVLAAAAADGYRDFDLGRGRERYKTSWCDTVIPLRDVRVGRTVRAKLYLFADARLTASKKRIRDSDRLWAAAKRVRRLVGARS